MLVECLAGKIFIIIIIIIIIILDTVFMTKTQSRHSFDNLTIRVVDRAFRGLNNVSLWKHDDSLGSSSSLSLSLSLCFHPVTAASILDSQTLFLILILNLFSLLFSLFCLFIFYFCLLKSLSAKHISFYLFFSIIDSALSCYLLLKAKYAWKYIK